MSHVRVRHISPQSRQAFLLRLYLLRPAGNSHEQGPAQLRVIHFKTRLA